MHNIVDFANILIKKEKHQGPIGPKRSQEKSLIQISIPEKKIMIHVFKHERPLWLKISDDLSPWCPIKGLSWSHYWIHPSETGKHENKAPLRD